MGWGSSKKKVYINCQVAPVVEEAMVPIAVKSAAVRALIRNLNLTETVMDEAMYGGHRRFDRYYRYGRDSYFYGLPNARVLSTSDGFELAKAAIESEVGQAVNIEYMHFRPLNNTHAGFKYATEEMGYNHDTNELETLTAYFGGEIPVYLDKMVAVNQSDSSIDYPEASSQGTFGDTVSSAGFSDIRPALLTSYALRTQVIEQENRIGDNETESVEIWWGAVNEETQEYLSEMTLVDLTAYDQDQEYYQAKYTYVVGTETITAYWIYDPYTGTHTALNDVFADLTYIDPGTYYPFAILRSENTNRADEEYENTPQYDTTERMLKYIGVDFKEMADAIQTDADGTNIETAALVLAAPINTQHEVQIEYLMKYFERLTTQLPPEALAVKPKVTSSKSAAPEVTYAVQITDADFTMTISFDGLYIRQRAGNLPGGAEFTNTTETLDTMPPGISDKKVAPYTVRVYRQQTRPGIYKEIRVLNPQIRYKVRNKGADGGFDDERCMIPLDRALVKEMPLLLQQELYFRSLYTVFLSRTVVKEKWYETGIFKVILVVAMVAITVLSGGTSSPLLAAVLAGTVTTAIVMAALMAFVESILIGLVIQYGLTMVVELVGAELGMYLAIAAAIVGAAYGYADGGFIAESTASNLMMASSGLFQGVQAELGNMFTEYQSDLEAFNLMKEDMTDALAETRKQLDSGIEINPMDFIGSTPLLVMGEPPNSFFHRTVHIGNPGVESLNKIQNFVSDSLTLPTATETLGDTWA